MADLGALVLGRGARRAGLAAVGAAVLALSQMGAGLHLGMTVTASASVAPSGHPNRVSPTPPSRRVNHLPPPPKPLPGTPQPASGPLRAAPAVSMAPALVALDPVAGAHFLSSDGDLELTVPAGAVTAADVAAAGGQLSLLVRQVLPASGGNAGGSGHYSFGTWLLQVVGAAGQPAARGLRQEVAVALHQGQRASALDLSHVYLLVNPPLPSWFDPSPGAVAPPPTSPVSGARRAATPSPSPSPTPKSSARTALGPAGRRTTAVDTSGDGIVLSASLPMASASTSMGYGTNSTVATFGRPEVFETDLAAGGLSAGIQLDLPAGPGGLTPPLTLAYNSASVSDQHNLQGGAPWVGEGWSLGLGAISWAEHNVKSSCPPETCGVNWEDSWQLSDPYGTAADLVPPAITVKTYNDDSTNTITPSPVTWHTAPESRARVISFTSPAPPPGMSPAPPCFRAFLPSGIMEEFGCTQDSLQYYPTLSGGGTANFIANWLLDLITDPEGNQVHVSYQRDMATGAGGVVYPRDAVLGTVEYDSPGCHDAQVACAGAAWAPLMRVSFQAGHAIAHAGGTTCPANGSLRCDDPIDLSASDGLPAPAVQSTFVLNDVQVQVRAGEMAAWNTLRDYRLSYLQGGPGI